MLLGRIYLFVKWLAKICRRNRYGIRFLESADQRIVAKKKAGRTRKLQRGPGESFRSIQIRFGCYVIFKKPAESRGVHECGEAAFGCGASQLR